MNEFEKASGAAADVDDLQAALIAPGENLVERHQRLPACRIGRSVEQHLDLRVITLRRGVGQPAARLEVEILQVVVGPLAARVRGQHLADLAALAPVMDLGRSSKNRRERASRTGSVPS